MEFDVDFETDILARALKSTDFLKKASRVLDAHHFATDQHAWVWKALKDVWDRFRERPTMKLLVARAVADFPKREDRQVYLEFLKKVRAKKPRAASATLEELSRFVRFVNAQAFLETAAKKLAEGELDAAYGAMKDAVRRDLKPRDYVVESWIEGFQERQRLRKYRKEHPEEIPRVPTGLPTLDRVLNGGVEVCEFGLLLATTGVGKSIGLVNFGYHAIRRSHPTLYLSLEMPASQIAQRFDSRWLGFEYDKIKSYGLKPSELREAEHRYDKAREHFDKKLRIVEMPLRSCSIESIRGAMDDLRAQDDFQPRVILVDSGDHMQSVGKYESYRLSQSAVYWDLAGLAGEGHVVWTSTHASKEYATSIATAEATGESYDKARIADIVFSLNTSLKKGRKTVVDDDDDEDEDEDGDVVVSAPVSPYKLVGKYVEGYLAKYRDGLSRITVPMDAVFNCMLLKEVDG